MKDKIIETLRQFNDEFQEDVIADFYIEEIAARIDSLYPTLNRDKVIGVLDKFVYDMLSKDPNRNKEDAANALCSLSLPTLSEGEIEKAFYTHAKPIAGDTKWMNLSEFKAAMIQLTKPKEE